MDENLRARKMEIMNLAGSKSTWDYGIPLQNAAVLYGGDLAKSGHRGKILLKALHKVFLTSIAFFSPVSFLNKIG
jgi:hypothetical protein